jgi:molybdate transport system substrate-binding protein
VHAIRALWLGLAVGAPMEPGCRKTAPGEKEPLLVAAAADLAFAFRDLGKRYEEETGQRVVLSFGSTGLLEKQIAEGAPFDVFAAANVAFADDAIATGACLEDSKALYATGRIVLFAAPDASFVAHEMRDLADPRVRRIAIANPEHAPYGRAAKQAIERAGLERAAVPKLVYGENVQEALQFARSGNADVAIVAQSLATMTPGQWSPVPPDLHDRIDQALVVCTRGRAGAAAGRRFAAFVRSLESRAVMRRYGFALPDDSLVDAGATPAGP